jgi:hypothetical protein
LDDDLGGPAPIPARPAAIDSDDSPVRAPAPARPAPPLPPSDGGIRADPDLGSDADSLEDGDAVIAALQARLNAIPDGGSESDGELDADAVARRYGIELGDPAEEEEDLEPAPPDE